MAMMLGPIDENAHEASWSAIDALDLLDPLGALGLVLGVIGLLAALIVAGLHGPRRHRF